MVTYLGSGVPVLLHGPEDSAAGNLLRGADAALVADSLDVRAVAEILAFGGDRGPVVADNALRLARQRFRLSDVRARFWQPILEASERADAACDRRKGVPARGASTPAGALSQTSIGVVIPCYESRRFVRDTIESLLLQTRQPDHVVVVDDGSADDPESAIGDLVQRHDRLRVVRQENAGVAAARNRGADLLVECDFVLFLDADDMLAPMMLERLASVLQARSSAAMAWCLPDFVDEYGRPTSSAVWAPRRRRRGMWRTEDVPDAVSETSFASLFTIPGIVPSVSLMRTGAFIAAGRWDPSFGQGYEDLDLFLRLRLQGDVLFVPERLVRYRRHAAQSTSNADHYWRQEQKLRARWRDLESLDPRERAMVLDAWRFWDRRLMIRRAGSVAGTRLREGQWWLALRAVLGGVRILVRSLARHRRSALRA
jgi:GT2 family glycosyltransferase